MPRAADGQIPDKNGPGIPYLRHMISQSTRTNRRGFLAAGTSALGLAPMAWLRAQDASPNDEIAIDTKHPCLGSRVNA